MALTTRLVEQLGELLAYGLRLTSAHLTDCVRDRVTALLVVTA